MSHSIMFGPSASHTWLKCPYSAFARANTPNTTSSYAEAGTLAHELCEIKVKLASGQMSAYEFEERRARIEANPIFDAGMKGSSQLYLETIQQLETMYFKYQPFVAVERTVSYSDICGEDGFGTADCILYGESTLVVVDYKNGSGVPVSAEENPQMKLYALGALQSVVDPLVYDIDKIVLCIVQPNVYEEPQIWETCKADLMSWVESTLKPAVKNIQEKKFFKRAGGWCKSGFCPNYVNCTAWREHFASVYADYASEDKDLNLDSLSADELGELYTKIYELKGWMETLQNHVECLVTSKTPVKGWKLVEGRSKRFIKDPDGMEAALTKAGFDPAMTHSTPELLPITKLEKLFGGAKAFNAACKDYIGKTKDKPAVVPESDPRKAIDSASSDFEEFAPKTEPSVSENKPAT